MYIGARSEEDAQAAAAEMLSVNSRQYPNAVIESVAEYVQADNTEPTIN